MPGDAIHATGGRLRQGELRQGPAMTGNGTSGKFTSSVAGRAGS